jgi:hypothetical protein
VPPTRRLVDPRVPAHEHRDDDAHHDEDHEDHGDRDERIRRVRPSAHASLPFFIFLFKKAFTSKGKPFFASPRVPRSFFLLAPTGTRFDPPKKKEKKTKKNDKKRNLVPLVPLVLFLVSFFQLLFSFF